MLLRLKWKQESSGKENHPDNGGGGCTLAYPVILRFYQEDFDKAIKYFERALTFKLSDLEVTVVNFILGELYEIHLQDYKKAIEHYEEAYGKGEYDFIKLRLSKLYEKRTQLVN